MCCAASPSNLAGTQDCHIHLHYSPCTSEEMTVEAIARRCDEIGIQQAGLINHLHPSTPEAVFVEARREIVASQISTPHFYMGLEADILDQRGNTSLKPGFFDLVDFTMLAMGHVQLPWVHFDLMLKPERFLIVEVESLICALESQRVDIVVHPFIYALMYKFNKSLAYSLRPHKLPSSLVSDLAHLLVEKNIYFEYHCRDLVIRPQNLGGQDFVASYNNFMLVLYGMGVKFISGSDAHRLDQIGRTKFAPAWSKEYTIYNLVSENNHER